MLRRLSLAHHPRPTDFDPGHVCGGALCSPPSTSARVRNRVEFVELGGDMCTKYHRRLWDYSLVR